MKEYCETYREHCSDRRVDHMQFMSFKDCQPFVNPTNIKRLIYYVRNGDKLPEIINKQDLIQLFYLAEYWQTPKSFVAKIIEQCEKNSEHPDIKPHALLLQYIRNQIQ